MVIGVAIYGALGHIPTDFQQFFSVHFRADSYFVRLPLQTCLLIVLFRVILCAKNNFHVVLCPSSRHILATPLLMVKVLSVEVCRTSHVAYEGNSKQVDGDL